ncbi:MAG: VOC family protein [Acidobacteria bacterium]|nr:VOC family protein [Acidobacteriota bacterium]
MSAGNSGAVMPMIKVDSVDETREYYVERLGFHHQMGVVGKDGSLDFCNLVFGDANLMFSRAVAPQAPAEGSQPVELYLFTPDVDAYFEKVKAKGVAVAEPLTDQWWGDRTFVVHDPNGYRLWFYTTVAEPVPPPGAKLV